MIPISITVPRSRRGAHSSYRAAATASMEQRTPKMCPRPRWLPVPARSHPQPQSTARGPGSIRIMYCTRELHLRIVPVNCARRERAPDRTLAGRPAALIPALMSSVGAPSRRVPPAVDTLRPLYQAITIAVRVLGPPETVHGTCSEAVRP